MKRIFVSFSLLAAALLVAGLIGGCEGPQGPPGEPAESNVAHLEGFAEDINCGECHNPDADTAYYVWAKRYQWELSKHYFGGDFDRNQASCSGCHTTEGFLEMAQGKPVQTHIDSSPPGCFACHSPHARGDFSLRIDEPVMLNETVAGQGTALFDYGKGNLCAQCHKPRTLNPLPNPALVNPTDTIRITSSRWYPHYGVQSQMLLGTGGFQFPGYNYTGNSNHTNNTVIKDEGCVVCHMADANAGSGIAGGHTMNITYGSNYLLNGCTLSGCHTAAGFDIDYIGQSSDLTGGVGTHTAVVELMDSLHTLLLDRGWITASGSINASGGNPLKIAPGVKAGALHNYFFIEHDLSHGSHNTRYTIELLLSSIEALNTP
jgi:hypothetical protein